MRESKDIFFYIKRILLLVLITSCLLELFLFPSWINFSGCLMMALSLTIFFPFLNRKYVLLYPFSFVMFLSMFLYRFLPLPATLIEGKPVTYGFELPIETFFFESLLFACSSIAFFIACPLNNKPRNNILNRFLFKIGFFKINKSAIISIGFIGFLITLYKLTIGIVEYGDVLGKLIEALGFLAYAPAVLLFPNLTGLQKSKLKYVIFYLLLLVFINIAKNSRQAIIEPFAIISILWLLDIIKNRKPVREIFKLWKLVLLVGIGFLGLTIISDLSNAMLYTRDIRTDVSKEELLKKTLEVYQNKELLKQVELQKKALTVENYNEGWTEDYIDNFMLNRYANLRISDQTIYLAQKKGFFNQTIIDDFSIQLWRVLPTPILNLIGIELDKEKIAYSRGDVLYGEGGGYRVTSHVGDGLATFGYWYFSLQTIVLIIIFWLLNSFVFYGKNKIIYAPLGLFLIFNFLGMFRNANGILGDIQFILREYVQLIFLYMLVFYFTSLLWNNLNPNNT